MGKWALGLASGWKHRETAAKLALAVSICSEGGATLDTAAAQHPLFGQLCASTGLAPSSGGLAPAPASKKRKKVEASELSLGLGQSVPEESKHSAGHGGVGLPKHKPF